MSKNAYSNVLRSFPQEVEVAYIFLIEDLGMTGPRFENIVIPRVSYSGGSYGYDVMLDTEAVTVHTNVWTDDGDGRVSVDLEKLLSANAAGGKRVRASAQTLAALKKTLAAQALLVRGIHHEVSGPHGQRLVREAAGS